MTSSLEEIQTMFTSFSQILSTGKNRPPIPALLYSAAIWEYTSITARFVERGSTVPRNDQTSYLHHHGVLVGSPSETTCLRQTKRMSGMAFIVL